MKKTAIFLKGIIKENPVLVLVLGACPTLAVTTNVLAALYMGLAALVVLVCSNLCISALKNLIGDNFKMAANILIITGFVSLVQMLMGAFLPKASDMLGIYLTLIAVNGVLIGNANDIARKNKVWDSVLSALGTGIGFTCGLFAVALVREILGNGTFAGIEIPFLADYKISLLNAAPGGFLVLGLVMALIAAINKKPVDEIGMSDRKEGEANA
ncbi:MAG: electron transport complex subunit RsxE [Lachnospiraceae bacterium]|nr:electron transport complex subunit RsxE [Lachnospiraceae bacterium]